MYKYIEILRYFCFLSKKELRIVENNFEFLKIMICIYNILGYILILFMFYFELKV